MSVPPPAVIPVDPNLRNREVETTEAMPSVSVSNERNVGEVSRLTGSAHYWTALAVSTSGERVAVGGITGRVYVWSMDDPTRIDVLNRRELRGHITALCFSADDKLLLVGFSNGAIVGVPLAEDDKAKIVRFSEHTSNVTCIKPFHDNERVLSSGGDEKVRIWKMSDGKEEKVFGGYTQSVDSLWISDDDNTVVSSDGLAVETRDLTGKGRKKDRLTAASVMTPAISADGKQLIYFRKRALVVRSLSSGKEKPLLENAVIGQLPISPGPSSCSPDGRYVAVADMRNRTILVYNAIRRTFVGGFLGHTDPILNVAFVPGSRLLVSRSADRTVRVWRLPDDGEDEMPVKKGSKDKSSATKKKDAAADDKDGGAPVDRKDTAADEK